MAAIAPAAFVVARAMTPAAAQALPDDFVYLREVAPTIRQDIRYAGINNFVGRPLVGYDGAECVVKRQVGLALQKVQQALAPQKLSLKMLDCYRPARAVHDGRHGARIYRHQRLGISRLARAPLCRYPRTAVARGRVAHVQRARDQRRLADGKLEIFGFALADEFARVVGTSRRIPDAGWVHGLEQSGLLPGLAGIFQAFP